jgi:hypothetical protein
LAKNSWAAMTYAFICGAVVLVLLYVFGDTLYLYGQLYQMLLPTKGILEVIILASSLLISLAIIAQHKERRVLTEPSFKVTYKKLIILTLCITLLFSVVQSVVLIGYSLPDGDAVSYIHGILQFQQKGIFSTFSSDERPLSTIVLSTIYSLLSLTGVAGSKLLVLTFLMADALFIYVAALFSSLLIRENGYDTGVIALSELVFISSAQILRMTGDLYANLFAISFVYLFLFLILPITRESDVYHVKLAVISGLTIFAILLIHFQTFIFALTEFSLVAYLSIRSSRDEFKKRKIGFFAITITTLAMLALPFIYESSTDPMYFGVLSRQLGDVSGRYFLLFGTIIQQTVTIGSYDVGMLFNVTTQYGNLLLTIFMIWSLVSLYLLTRHNKATTLSIISATWSMVIFIPSLIATILFKYSVYNVSNITLAWRLLLMLPIPLISAFGIEEIFEKSLVTQVRIQHTRPDTEMVCKILKISALVFLILGSVQFQLEYRSVYQKVPNLPTDNLLNEANRIKNIFGYGNDSYVVYIKFSNVSEITRLPEWVVDITGMSVYYGTSSMYYLAGKNEPSLYGSSEYIGMTNSLQKNGMMNNTIVISDLLSEPNSYELIDSREIVHGIYVVNMNSSRATKILDKMNSPPQFPFK